MNWEERKRERKPPAPSSDYKPSGHEAAPYYTEDLTFLDSHDTNSFPSDFNSRRPEDPQHTESHIQDTHFLQELKEKCAFLESQLHNSKLKLSHIEKDNEKLHEELSQALSNRKNFLLEQELAIYKGQLDIKTKQVETLEKALRAERSKYSQELQDFKSQMRSLKENYSIEKRTVTVNEDNEYELKETKEENRNLKAKIKALEQEKNKIIEKYENDLQEQYNYFKELLEEKNSTIENHEKSENFEKSSEVKSEEFQEHPEKSEEFQENFGKSEEFQETYEKSVEKKSEEKKSVEDLTDQEQDLQIYDTVPETYFNQPSDPAQHFWTDAPTQISDFFSSEKPEKLGQFFESDENPPLFNENQNLFEVFEQKKPYSSKSSSKSPEIVENPLDFFEQSKPGPINSNLFSNEENPTDFFSNLHPVSNYQTIPSNLFDT